MKLFPLGLAILVGALGCAAQTCTTSSNASVNGLSVNASAKFAVGGGFITVTVSNSLANPLSAAQLLNGVAFVLNTGQTDGSLSSSAATIRAVKKDKSFVDSGPSATGWALATDYNGGLMLCVLCTDLGGVGPSHLLIGDPAASGTYASANASLAGNRPHNPFTAGAATFSLAVPDATAGAIVTSATFFFGTQPGVSAQGSCGGGGGPM
jgi:hypothetical protein